MNIVRAIIRIDIEDYLRGLKNHPGYIDGTDTFFAPSEEREVGDYDTLEEAEAAIDRTVDLTITDDEAVIEYEYISGSEDLYFNEVYFSGSTYPLDSDMSSESCYEAILKSFGHIYERYSVEVRGELSDEAAIEAALNSPDGVREVIHKKDPLEITLEKFIWQGKTGTMTTVDYFLEV
jgi:hypothetical protein